MQLEHSAIMRTLDWLYEKAINGGAGFGTIEELAEDYLKSDGTLYDKAGSLIRWQTTKSATSGFIAGLGGIAFLPATLPINITSVILIQLRLIAAIAYMGGHDVRDDRVKTLCYTCLCGNAAKDMLKGIGIQTSTKLSQQAIKNLSFEVIKTINQKVGYRFLTKFGTTGSINLVKAIPLAGGVIGGTFDGVSTRAVGQIARKVFIGVKEK